MIENVRMQRICWRSSGLVLLSGLSLLSLACGSSHNNKNKLNAGTMAGGVAETAGAAAQAGQSGAAGAPTVLCGGSVCGIPDMAFGVDVKSLPLDFRPCCYNDTCGLKVLGNASINEVCVGVGAPAPQATTGCMSRFDKELNVYKWGCCLSDGYCGEIWNGMDAFGCADPRLINGPVTETCQAGVPCKGLLHAPCTSSEECCSIPPAGTSCVAFSGNSTVCAPNCEEDSDCGTQCCRPAVNGVKACAPTEICFPPAP
jgi:hypothetical protein